MVGDGVDYTHADPAVDRRWFAQKVDATGQVQWQARFGDVGFNYGKVPCKARLRHWPVCIGKAS